MLRASVKDDPGAAAKRMPWLTRSSKSTAEGADLRPGYWKRRGQLGDRGRRAGGCRKQDLKVGGKQLEASERVGGSTAHRTG